MNIFLSSFANQFWSDPSFLSSYYKATFRPRTALPGEVTLLIPNLFNVGETVPVNIPTCDLMNIYMTIFRNTISDSDLVEEDPIEKLYDQANAQRSRIPPEWYDYQIYYRLNLELKTVHCLMM